MYVYILPSFGGARLKLLSLSSPTPVFQPETIINYRYGKCVAEKVWDLVYRLQCALTRSLPWRFVSPRARALYSPLSLFP